MDFYDREIQILQSFSRLVPSDSNKDFAESEWTTERTLDELFLCLAGKREVIPDKREDGTIIYYRKYYHQALKLFMWIPIAKPLPEFVINVSDLSPKIIQELQQNITSNSTRRYVVIQAVGRIFENIDSRYHHLSIALRQRDKVKDDAISQLSDQLMTLTTRLQEIERRQQLS
jgi:hypothetical protein